MPYADLPPEVLSQLAALPEEAPDDFACAVCGSIASNRWNYSPREFERPPICKSCENIVGYAWHGGVKCRTKPSGGTHHDKRQALRIAALADAIAAEASEQQWSAAHGHP